MNAVHAAPAPLYRPQLGVVSGGQQLPNGPSSSLNERDDSRSLRNQGYTDNTITSPLSPSDSSDFSYSRYQNDTYTQQRNNSTTTPTMGFANENLMANSGSNNSLSPNQRSSGGSGSAPRDVVVIEHYVALKNYLTRHLAVDGGLNQRQNKAREKLVRLSKTQFNELSTDVYDELMRRQNTQMNQPFLVPRDNFHPKRNQARQKLATLPPGRFKELAADVLYEIERRYPVSVDAANSQHLTTNNNNGQRTASGSSLGSRGSDQSYPYTPRSNEFPPSSSRDRFLSNGSSNNLAIPTIPEEPTETDTVQRTGMQNTIIPDKSVMVEEGPDEDDDTIDPPSAKNGPVQKTFMANTIVPNTSTMVEESADDDSDSHDDNQRTSVLAPTITSTKSMSPPIFKSKAFANANASRNRSISPPPVLSKSRAQIEEEQRKEQEVQDKIDEYEDKIEALKERIAELQDDLKNTQTELKMEKSKPPPPAPPINDRRLKELEVENDRLKEELREQQEVTNDVQREATELLEEMRSLTSQQDAFLDNHTNSTREVARLQAEIREWKSRYSQLKVQVRSSNPSSIASSSHLNSPIRIDLKSRLVLTDDGIIEDSSVSRFQNSIDELLSAARRDDNEVLEVMTEVVKATRAITDDLKRYGNHAVEDDPNVRKLTSRLSATANNLITATKNHVSSHGLSPVSLVDAAASHLTSTVVDLVKIVKMRSSSGTSASVRTDEDAQSDHSRYSELATPLTSPIGPVSSPSNKTVPGALNLGSRSNLAPRTTALREEIFSPRSPESPRSMDSRRSSTRNIYSSKDEEELRLYLDTQTQAIVESIQSLLTRIRNPKLNSVDDFRPQIDEITLIVEKIVEYADRQGSKIDRFGGEKNRLMTILRQLEDCCGLMKNVARTPSSEDDGFKKRLARITFDISKQIKELVRIVESESPLSSANDLT